MVYISVSVLKTIQQFQFVLAEDLLSIEYIFVSERNTNRKIVKLRPKICLIIIATWSISFLS